MNESDSERIASFLESQKIKPTKDIAKANFVIFNTCGIRQMAEDRAYGQIHNIHKLKVESRKSKTIILTGCLANRKDVQKRLKDKVDLFCEIKDFQKEFIHFFYCHPELVSGSDKIKMPKQVRHDKFSYLCITPQYSNPHTAYVPIMTGCNNFCSYCVVPYARGREVSRSSKEIILEIKNLLKNGCKEIILLGQNVNSYHGACNMKHETKKINFAELLQLIEKIPGHFWISFMSSHPKDFSKELIETIAQSKKICEHIHLPLQAGDNKILLAMNRKYTAEKYLRLMEKIKSAFAKYKPDELYSITTDIIVGFPGETKKQFLESACVMKKVDYDLVYFGQFSPRPGTVAYEMKDNVSKDEKKKREFFLNEILKKTAFENNQKYIGKILEVLIDKKDGSNYFGRTHSLKNVKIHLTPTLSLSRRGSLVGKFVKVKITKANIWNLEACLPVGMAKLDIKP